MVFKSERICHSKHEREHEVCKRVSLTTNQRTLIRSSHADGRVGSGNERSEQNRNRTSSFKFVFHEKQLPFKRLDFNNCTGPNKVRIEL